MNEKQFKRGEEIKYALRYLDELDNKINEFVGDVDISLFPQAIVDMKTAVKNKRTDYRKEFAEL